MNVFGVIEVSNAMLPLLRRSAAGRIVSVSSAVGSISWSADPNNPYADHNLLGYATSKSALNALTVAYARELRADGIAVNACCPGPVSEDPGRTADDGARIIVRLAARGGIELRDKCGCLTVRAMGSHRIGRTGVDVWLSLDFAADR